MATNDTPPVIVAAGDDDDRNDASSADTGQSPRRDRRIRDFGVRLGGADPRKIDSTYEHTVFTSRGLLLLIVPTFASGVMFVALKTFFGPENWPYYLPFCLLWFIFVFLIDRWIVSTIDLPDLEVEEESAFWRAARTARRAAAWLIRIIARVAMAGIIALLISEPLIYQVFHTSIAAKQAEIREDVKKDARTRIERTMRTKTDELLAKRDGAVAAVAPAQEYAEKMKLAALCEHTPDQAVCEDVPKTGDYGDGREYREAQADAADAASKAKSASDLAKTATEEYDKAVTEYATNLQLAYNNSDRAIDARDTDPGEQHAALEMAMNDPDNPIAFQVWLWRGGAFALELMPLLAKLLSPKNGHDQRMRLQAVQRHRGAVEAAVAEADGALEERRQAVTHTTAASKLKHEAELEALREERWVDVDEKAAERKHSSVMRSIQYAADEADLREKMERRPQQPAGETDAGEPSASETDGPPAHVVTIDPFFEATGTATRPPSTPVGGAAFDEARGTTRVIGSRWELIGPIHTGASSASQTGSVYKVHDTRPNSPWPGECVVKRILSPTDYRSEDKKNAGRRASAFAQRESLPLEQQISPFVAPIIDAGFDPTYGYYQVTPYYSKPLPTYLAEIDTQLTLDKALGFAKQVLLGLKAVWTLSSPLLHLDIKPYNIMVKEESWEDGEKTFTRPVMKIIDFGQALAPGSPFPEHGFGTPGFAPLEQFDPFGARATGKKHSRGAAAGFSSDIYALGCTLYWMLTGQTPWAYEMELAGIIRNGEIVHDYPDPHGDRCRLMFERENPLPANRWLPTLPPAVSGLLSQWMAYKPVRRGDGTDGEAYAANAIRHLDSVIDEVWEQNMQEMPVGRGAVARMNLHYPRPHQGDRQHGAYADTGLGGHDLGGQAGANDGTSGAGGRGGSTDYGTPDERHPRQDDYSPGSRRESKYYRDED